MKLELLDLELMMLGVMEEVTFGELVLLEVLLLKLMVVVLEGVTCGESVLLEVLVEVLSVKLVLFEFEGHIAEGFGVGVTGDGGFGALCIKLTRLLSAVGNKNGNIWYNVD